MAGRAVVPRVGRASEHGRDFDDAKEQAARIATERDLEYAPSFHRDFVVGVATYAFELFTAVVDLDTVFVPIGLGSGICGVIGVRDLLGLKTNIVGVVAESANTYSLSVAARRIAPTASALTFADLCEQGYRAELSLMIVKP